MIESFCFDDVMIGACSQSFFAIGGQFHPLRFDMSEPNQHAKKGIWGSLFGMVENQNWIDRRGLLSIHLFLFFHPLLVQNIQQPF